MIKNWYAVTSNEYTEWDRGSYEYEMAKTIAMDAVLNKEQKVMIAVIDECENPICISAEEFEWNDAVRYLMRVYGNVPEDGLTDYNDWMVCSNDKKGYTEFLKFHKRSSESEIKEMWERMPIVGNYRADTVFNILWGDIL